MYLRIRIPLAPPAVFGSRVPAIGIAAGTPGWPIHGRRTTGAGERDVLWLARCYRVYVTVAKVMISLPDHLLARLDAQAAERDTTRSATLRDLAEAALGERERLLAERMAELEGQAEGHGGDVLTDLKAGRRLIFLDASVLLATEDLDDPNHAAAVALLRTGSSGDP